MFLPPSGSQVLVRFNADPPPYYVVLQFLALGQNLFDKRCVKPVFISPRVPKGHVQRPVFEVFA